MQIAVRLFAILKERAGVQSFTLELPDGCTATDAADRIATAYPGIQSYLPKSAFAINRAYGNRQAILHDGDELALIPPVSGGTER